MTKTPRTYPLDALLRLRGEIRSRREQALAGAVARLEAAEQAADQARACAEEGRAAAARAADALGTPGARSGAELQERERYSQRLRREAAALEQAARQAAEAVLAAEAALESARAALARAEADVKLVEQNREAWDLARRTEATRKAEEELEDLVAARHRRPSREDPNRSDEP